MEKRHLERKRQLRRRPRCCSCCKVSSGRSRFRLQLEMDPDQAAKSKGKVPLGCLSVGAGHCVQIFLAPRASLGIILLSSALSQLHTLCVAQLLQTPWIICLRWTRQKLTDFCLFCTINHPQYYQGRVCIPLMALTSCHERGSNLLSPDERASTLTTQPIRLVLYG